MRKFYVGTKAIFGEPMTRLVYNQYRGWEMPENENGDDKGYLVEYMNGGGQNDLRHAGYISWSPKEVFEQAYQSCDQMNFSHALEMLKLGYRVCRAGWNGKDMFIYLIGPIERSVYWSPEVNYFGPEALIQMGPCLLLKGVDGTINTWVSSISDLLADDWSTL